MMTMWLLGLVYFAIDATAILLLVGCWQRTRFAGFLMLAASYGLGLLARWGSSLLYRSMESGQVEGVTLVVQAFYLVIAALALAGIWDIYRRLRPVPVVPPPEA